MVFAVVGGDGKPTGYEISNSVRYNDDDSPQLSRTMSSGNQQIFTLSTWLKRANVSNGNQRIFSSDDEASADFRLRFISADTLEFTDGYTGNSNTYTEVYTKRKFRDVSAWYHIVLAVDTTQGTAANRVKIYVNGVEETDLDNGSSGSTKYPSQNDNLGFGRNGKTLEVGASLYSSSPRQSVDMYLAETYAVDGAQLTPNYFGEFNDNNVWIPVKPGTGAGGSITYGTNGFLLEYKQTGTSANSSGIGADTSGNDNHFTPTNLAATDITTDTPTNNFATLNSLTNSEMTFSEGNTKTVRGGTDGQFATSTFETNKGKWYFESKLLNYSGNSRPTIGLSQSSKSFASTLAGTSNNRVYYLLETSYYQSNSASAVTVNSSPATNDIYMWGVDLDNLKFYIGKNGTWLHSSDPSAGSNGLTIEAADYYAVATGPNDDGTDTSRNNEWFFNFGNPAYSISSGNADGAGHGNFEYAVPSGFFSYCTKNLAEFG